MSFDHDAFIDHIHLIRMLSARADDYITQYNDWCALRIRYFSGLYIDRIDIKSHILQIELSASKNCKVDYGLFRNDLYVPHPIFVIHFDGENMNPTVHISFPTAGYCAFVSKYHRVKLKDIPKEELNAVKSILILMHKKSNAVINCAKQLKYKVPANSRRYFTYNCDNIIKRHMRITDNVRVILSNFC